MIYCALHRYLECGGHLNTEYPTHRASKYTIGRILFSEEMQSEYSETFEKCYPNGIRAITYNNKSIATAPPRLSTVLQVGWDIS